MRRCAANWESRLLVEQVLAEIVGCLARGDTVKLTGFGAFAVRQLLSRCSSAFCWCRGALIVDALVTAIDAVPTIRRTLYNALRSRDTLLS